jgi:hypothetical protein
MLRTHSNGITLPLGLQSLHFYLVNIKKNVIATYNTMSASTGSSHDSHSVQDSNERMGEKN